MSYFYAVDKNYLREKYQDELKNLTPAKKEAFLFRKYLETIPVYIEQEDLCAGWYGYQGGVPEDQKEFGEKAREKQQMEHQKRVQEREPRTIMNDRYCFQAAGYDRGHNLMDYQAMIGRGIEDYIREVDERLKHTAAESPEAEYLKIMKESLNDSLIFAERYADLAGEMAAKSTDETEKKRLFRIEKACRRVPRYAPEDFYEAIQSAYLLWSLNCISEMGWVSISFGSFDQYMYPYYQKSKEKGMSDNEIEALLVDLYRKLDVYEGMDCALSIGGIDKNGEDATNELSYLILSAEKKSLLRAPLFTVRINRKTPDKLMDELVDSRLFAMGQPTFYSEEYCKKAVMSRGIEEEEASRYMISTCMQMEFPGDQVNASWGIVTNLHLPLELALNGGKPLHGELPIRLETVPRTDYQSIDEIYEQYRSYLKEIFAYMKKWNLQDTREFREPNPWLSAMTGNCIEKGKDRWEIGVVKYHDVTVENFAFANTADALGAVERLVFETGQYTIPELLKAVGENFEGYEEIHDAVMNCPKYGMNDRKADEKARRIMEIVSDICEGNREGNIRFLASLHTLHNDVYRGAQYYATLDGRLKGEPFNKNAGPANPARSKGPTAIALSACRLNQIRLSGGQALDIHFAIPNMDKPDKKRKIGAFIKTYLQNGGLQMQVNALSSQTLQQAYEEPEKYRNLIVRIGGHSRYFYELDDAVKREFIHRISVEEGAGM